MNTTFIKLAFRNLRKNKINTIINIFGFSIGLAACLFIFMFTRLETSYDSFYPNQDRFYRLVDQFTTSHQTTKEGFVSFPVAPAVAKNISGIESYCRVTDEATSNCYINQQQITINKLRFADDNFFDFFQFKLIVGNPESVLNSAEKIVLTKAMALKMFGTMNVVGKTIVYQHQNFTISGIAEIPPNNTHLNFGAIASIKYIENSDVYWKGWGGGITFLSYLKLLPNVSPQQIEQQFPNLLEEKINQQWRNSGFSYALSLQKISDIHLSDGSIVYDCSSNRNKNSIYFIDIISLLILILAMVNYVILYTGQNLNKTKEIGIFKLHGSKKFDITLQTYIEVFIVSGVSAMIGFVLLGISLPFLNAQLNTHITFEQNWFSSIGFAIATALVLSAIVTLFSTVKTIKINIIDYVKGNYRIKAKENNLMISIQFAIVILLIIAVFGISKQNQYLLNSELGFNKDNTLIIESDEEFLNGELSSFKQELLQIAEVQAVSLSSQTIGTGLTQNGYLIDGETENTMLNVIYTDKDFLNCFGINLIEGNNFSTNDTQNKDAILVNKEMLTRTGWEEPIGKTIDRNGKLQVIGVVDNFNFSSLKHAIKPLLIMANPAWDGWGYSTVNIHYQTSDIQNFVNNINKLWQEQFPEAPCNIRFFDDVLNQNYSSYKAQQKIISFFSLLSIFIAIIGLFGLTIFTIKNKTKEIGIRKVNGAKISEILVMLNKDFIKWVAIAFLIASPIAYIVMHKWLENFAYKTNLNWWVFILAGVFAIIVALFTVSWQSWKAATRNPVEALRYE
jgi:putative ABC transport system permease protein